MAPTLRKRATSDPRVTTYELASAGPSTPPSSRKRRAVTPASDDGVEDDEDAAAEEEEEPVKPAKKARAKSTKVKTAPTPAGNAKPPRPEWKKQYDVLLAQRERACASSIVMSIATCPRDRPSLGIS